MDIENFSAHGYPKSLPELQFVLVEFLPPRTISKIQLFDSSFIAAQKTTFRRLKINQVTYLMDVAATNIYKLDPFKAMRWIKSPKFAIFGFIPAFSDNFLIALCG